MKQESGAPDDLLTRLAPGGAEDFITEVFCWLLEKTDFGSVFLDNLCACDGCGCLPKIDEERIWSTQERFSLDVGLKRPDMICRSEDEKAALVFEHKVWSQLGREQLANYRKIKFKEEFDHFGIVLITPRQQERNKEADCHIFWENVHSWLSDWKPAGLDSNFAFVVSNFLSLLEERGLAPMEKITVDQLRQLPSEIAKARAAMGEQRKTEKALKTLVDRVVSGPDWDEFVGLVPKDEQPSMKRETEKKKFAWGRYGFHLDTDKDNPYWAPGVFVGVMTDSENHGPTSVNESNGSGPIACVIVSVQKDLWEKYESSEFKALVDALHREWSGSAPDDWQVYRETENNWHPLIVYKPLTSIIDQAKTGEEQVCAFANDVKTVVASLFHLDEFKEFKNFLASCKKAGELPTQTGDHSLAGS